MDNSPNSSWELVEDFKKRHGHLPNENGSPCPVCFKEGSLHRALALNGVEIETTPQKTVRFAERFQLLHDVAKYAARNERRLRHWRAEIKRAIDEERSEEVLDILQWLENPDKFDDRLDDLIIFEYEAQEFYWETHMLAPGNNQAMALNGTPSMEERTEAWKKWSPIDDEPLRALERFDTEGS